MQELKTLEDLEEYQKKSLAVLLLLEEGDESSLKKYQTFTMNYEDVPFAYSTNEELKKKLDVTQKVAFVVLRDFDDGNKFLVLDELADMSGFKSFFEAVRFPIVMKFDQQAAERIFGTQASAMIYFSDEQDEGYETFKKFASDNSNKILFSHSEITKDLGARLAEYIGITADQTGAVRILKFSGGNLDKFQVDDTSAEGLLAALENFEAGELKAYYKSEPIPETNTEAVKVIVGNSFEEMVLKSDKYVLLEAYAPWCGHC